MRFEPTEDQRDFAAALESLLSGAEPVAAARAWAAGEHGPGLKLWSRLADLGVPALLVPEADGGAGATPVEMVIAFEALGRHAVPGPWVEAAAYLPLVLRGAALEVVASGALVTVAVPPLVPRALDADVAEQSYAVVDGVLHTAGPRGGLDAVHVSVDRTRRLVDVTPGDPVETTDVTAAYDLAFDMAVLATSAQLLGAGERLLADSVAYVKQRRQFGREIGSYQAIKHALADVRIALDFARPLVHAAALGEISPSAAKLQCGEAAYLASRTGLQVHGAIGYTAEFDLSVWITKVRALLTAWGTPAWHRQRLLDTLLAAPIGQQV